MTQTREVPGRHRLLLTPSGDMSVTTAVWKGSHKPFSFQNDAVRLIKVPHGTEDGRRAGARRHPRGLEQQGCTATRSAAPASPRLVSSSCRAHRQKEGGGRDADTRPEAPPAASAPLPVHARVRLRRGPNELTGVKILEQCRHTGGADRETTTQVRLQNLPELEFQAPNFQNRLLRGRLTQTEGAGEFPPALGRQLAHSPVRTGARAVPSGPGIPAPKLAREGLRGEDEGKPWARRLSWPLPERSRAKGWHRPEHPTRGEGPRAQRCCGSPWKQTPTRELQTEADSERGAACL